MVLQCSHIIEVEVDNPSMALKKNFFSINKKKEKTKKLQKAKLKDHPIV